MATDPFAALAPAPILGYSNAVAITPSDSTDMTYTSRALYIGGAGNVTLIDSNGNTTTFTAVPVGSVLPIRATRIKATGTSATNLVALW